ncbi:hypothetical protein CTZ27_37340 [Streptomyces griseocarneus]|nr:hypothetical protein CTZ27_37340 [Streptomyces griseocarneus]
MVMRLAQEADRVGRLMRCGLPEGWEAEEKERWVARATLAYLDDMKPHASRLARRTARSATVTGRTRRNRLEIPPELASRGMALVLAALRAHAALGAGDAVEQASTALGVLDRYLDDTDLTEVERDAVASTVERARDASERTRGGLPPTLTEVQRAGRIAESALVLIDEFERRIVRQHGGWAAALWAEVPEARQDAAVGVTGETAVHAALHAAAQDAAVEGSAQPAARAVFDRLYRYLNEDRAQLTEQALANIKVLASELERLVSWERMAATDMRAAGMEHDAAEAGAEAVLEEVERARLRHQRRGERAEKRSAALASLPNGKLRPMCKLEYWHMVNQLLDATPIGPYTRPGRTARTLSFPSASAAEKAQRILGEVVGSDLVERCYDETALRLPQASMMGVQLKGARSCNCGRHFAQVLGKIIPVPFVRSGARSVTCESREEANYAYAALAKAFGVGSDRVRRVSDLEIEVPDPDVVEEERLAP